MHPKWVIGLGIIFVISVITCMTLETQSGEVSIISNAMSSWQGLEFSNPVQAGWSILMGIGTFLGTVWKIMTWDYAFFTGYWVWFRFLFMAISLGVLFSILLAVRGTSSG